MNYFLKKPIDKLQEILDKLNRTHEECHHYDYTECDYINSQVTNKEEFQKALKNAIKNLELANEYTRSDKK